VLKLKKAAGAALVMGSLAPVALAHEGHTGSEGLGHLMMSFHHYGGTWVVLALVAAYGARRVFARSKKR